MSIHQFLRARYQIVVKAWRDIDKKELDCEPLSPEEEEAYPLRDPELLSWIWNPNTVQYEVR